MHTGTRRGHIPVPQRQNYKLQSVEKIKLFIKRMRQEAIMYDTRCKENANGKIGAKK